MEAKKIKSCSLLLLLVISLFATEFTLMAQPSEQYRQNRYQQKRKADYRLLASNNSYRRIPRNYYRRVNQRVVKRPQAVYVNAPIRVVRNLSPHVGQRVLNVPQYSLYFNHHGANVFYAHGVFYTDDNCGYRIIHPPIGASLDDLPSNAEVVEFGGQIYFRIDKMFLQAVEGRRRNVFYEIVSVG